LPTAAYHFRYTAPALAAGGCRVFALDVCGFGWSDKPDVSYENYDVWRQQVTDFVEQVVGPGERVVLAGNSLGGFNVLNAAAARPDLVAGVVLLNAAGRFDPAGADGAPAPAAAVAAAAAAAAGAPAGFSLATLQASVTTAVKRAVIAATFLWTKQPARVRQVLRQVYVSETHIDDDLVRSILLPADHPNAAETFYRVITANGTPVNRLLARMAAAEVPLLLLWGARDPWCTPARADQIEGAYPAALTERVNVEAGVSSAASLSCQSKQKTSWNQPPTNQPLTNYRPLPKIKFQHCPFDDVPELVSPELLRWARARA
jgi:pimeloyl-ACP methyl ester carboxylesterase